MGCDVAANSRAARGIFDRAAAVLDYDLLELQREGPEEKLRETEYSQPAIFTTNVALYEAVGDEFEPVVTAGHSFGELCSLVAAHSLEFEEALRIVNERAKAMQHAAQLARGGMSAVLGLEAAQVRDVLQQLRSANVGRVSHGQLQLADADRDQRRPRRRASRDGADAGRRRQTRRAAQRIGSLAQRADGARRGTPGSRR